MSWLWGSSSDAASSSKASKDGAYEAPDRSKRVKCWDARDGYFHCLDRNNILDALKEKDVAGKACEKETQNFEENCAKSWVSTLPEYSPKVTAMAGLEASCLSSHDRAGNSGAFSLH
jgi:cytochrome c oxidase assembly factor 6